MSDVVAYTDIDTLFDFRLGVIAKHSGVGYNDVFVKDPNRYLTRNHNRFWEWTEAFTKEDYENWYYDRDKSDWALSGITDILNAITNDFDEIFKREGADLKYTLWVDILHYDLTATERNALKTLLMLELGRNINVNIVRTSPGELTPTFIAQNLTFIYQWDFNSWYNDFNKALLTNPCGDVMWFGSINTLYTKSEQEDFIKELKHNQQLTPEQREIVGNPAKFIHDLLLGYLDVNLIPLRAFSIDSRFILTNK